jgi:hypothetical protein
MLQVLSEVVCAEKLLDSDAQIVLPNPQDWRTLHRNNRKRLPHSDE